MTFQRIGFFTLFYRCVRRGRKRRSITEDDFRKLRHLLLLIAQDAESTADQSDRLLQWVGCETIPLRPTRPTYAYNLLIRALALRKCCHYRTLILHSRSIFGDASRTRGRRRHVLRIQLSVAVFSARYRSFIIRSGKPTTRKDWPNRWRMLLKFNELQGAISVPRHEVSETRRVTLALRYLLSSSVDLSAFFLYLHLSDDK